MRDARVDLSVRLAILGRPEPHDKFGLRVRLDDMREAIDRLPEFDFVILAFTA